MIMKPSVQFDEKALNFKISIAIEIYLLNTIDSISNNIEEEKEDCKSCD